MIYIALLLSIICYNKGIDGTEVGEALPAPVVAMKESPVPYYEYVFENDSYVTKTWPIPADSAIFDPKFETIINKKFQYYSQFEQDRIILTFFKDKPNGYFIDLATNHFEDGSNTFCLEYFNNWRGVCIEPNPEYRAGILGNRKCKLFTNPITGQKGEEIQFRFAARGWGALGGIVGAEFENHNHHENDVSLRTTTITDILDYVKAPSVIDYLSLDVEGAELLALRGLNYTKYRFLALTVERPNEHVHEFLNKHGYMWVFVFPGGAGECIYLHHTMPDFNKWMNEYRDCCDPCWAKHCHNYMTHPPWNGTYVGYNEHHKNHHSKEEEH